MPTYEFLNKKTKQIEEHVMSMSAYDDFVKDNPHLERYHNTAPMLMHHTTASDGIKTDNTWKEVMAKVAEKHPASPLADRYLRKSAKDIKTKEIIKKHQKKVADLHRRK